MSLSLATRKRLRDSRRSGNLALSNVDLIELPAAVCNPRDHLEEDERLYECIDLLKMDVNHNQLAALPEDIDALAGSLVVLQAAHNPLQRLPAALAAFSQLKLLNLSHCRLTQFPTVVCALDALVELRLDHNAIEELPAEGLGGLVELQVLQLESNRIRALPHSVGRLGKMLRLHLSQNQLAALPESLGALARLEVLEVRENQLQALSARVTTGLARLRTLDARRNHLRELPMLPESPDLRELLLSFNAIARLDAARLASAPNLATLDLADNKLETIDSTVADLRALAFLNVSNNNLRGLPHALGYLPKLTRLLAEQNPIRTISRSVLTGSCEGLKKYLRSRGPAPGGGGGGGDGGGGGGGSGGRSAWSIVEDGQLLLDKLPDASAEATLREMLQRGQAYGTCKTLSAGGVGGGAGRCLPLVVHLLEAHQFNAVETLRLEKVGLEDVPVVLSQLPNLTDLGLAFNALRASSFAELLGLRARGALPVYFPRLQRLDLGRNQLQYLSAALVHGLTSLRELSLGYNRLTTVQRVALGGGRTGPFAQWAEAFPALETLDLSNNQLTADGGGLDGLVALKETLKALNIANNNLSAIPPPLGRLTGLRSLLVEGNPQKSIPWSIISQGTTAILHALQRKLPADAAPPAAAPVNTNRLQNELAAAEAAVAVLTDQLGDFGLSNAKKYAVKKELAMAKSKAIRLRRQIDQAAKQQPGAGGGGGGEGGVGGGGAHPR